MQLGPEQRECYVCKNTGTAPELMPYVSKGGHIWAHPRCMADFMAAHREKQAHPYQHEHGDCA